MTNIEKKIESLENSINRMESSQNRIEIVLIGDKFDEKGLCQDMTIMKDKVDKLELKNKQRVWISAAFGSFSAAATIIFTWVLGILKIG